MRLKELACENCGAAVGWDGKYGTLITCEYCGSTFLPEATVLEDVWMMTDPVARARYEFEGRLDQLEHDIRFEVMRGHDWSAMDRAYLAETGRLEEAGAIRRLSSFWAVSPHPPIYRAVHPGEVKLGEHAIPFDDGDEIVWACPMTRDRFDLDLPVIVGDLQESRVQQLCQDMQNAMQGRMA